MYPALNADGSQMTFSYQGDIWVANADGSSPRRLTIHESYESHPQWSPDGQHIVFQGNRFGNNDIFVIDTKGSYPTRLTYHSTSDGSAKWIDNETIMFSTNRGFKQVEREAEIFKVSASGGTPERVIDAVGLSPATSPSGQIALVRGNCRIARETYTGPANRNIWIYNNDSYTPIVNDSSQDIKPDWAGETLYYLSAKSGRYNIYRINTATNGAPEQLTSFTDEGITSFDVNADGSLLVYSRGGMTYTMPTELGATAVPISFELSQDDRFDPVQSRTFNGNINEFVLSPDEKQIATVIHGELFLKLNDKDQKRTRQLTDHPYRDKNPVWVNDSTLLFSSDREGSFDIYRLTSAEKETGLYQSFDLKVERLTNHKDEEENLTISPDGKKLIYNRGRGQLVITDIDSMGNLSNEKLLYDDWGAPSDVAWSPDSRWVAYSRSDLDFNAEIYVQPVDMSSDPVNISLHPRPDRSPVWSADGSKLGFLSDRNNDDTDVWFVWLRKKDWDKTRRDWDDDEYWNKDDDKKKDSVVVEIDFENIHRRLQQVTRMAGNEGGLSIGGDSETFYFTTNGGGWSGSPGRSSLLSAKWNGEDVTTVIPNISIWGSEMDKKGKNLYIIQSPGSLAKITLSSKKREMQSLSATMKIDTRAEREQVFEEAWRRLRDGFYDPEFHGRDWSALKAKYRDRCLNASTTQDFYTFYNEMLGQLDASHMGLRGGTPENTQRERTGLLGIDVTPQSNGLAIKSVIPGTPADREESKLMAGDVITAINNTPITASTNMYSLLNGQTNERTQLTVRRTDGTTEKVIIRPAGSIRSANYDAWVQARREMTDRYSGGRLGYIHIQGMNWPSFERFERELAASGQGKDGIVIDVRFNGGGWTTDMLMTVLNVRQHAYTIPRGAAKTLEGEKGKFREHYPYGERLPLSSWTKPRIALCNENSYSNAEIFSHAFKALGHGTLVGQPTFGAVISTGGAGLLDGSFVRMPFRAWYVKDSDMNMEHGPAVPDIIVKNMPDSKANGEDPQLKAAVDELLSQINGK